MDYVDQQDTAQEDTNTNESSTSTDSDKAESVTIAPVGAKVDLTEDKTAIRGVTLEKIGTVASQKNLLFSKGDLLRANGDFICVDNGDGTFTMCDSQGNAIENGTFSGVDTPYDDYVILYKEGELFPQSQLMTVKGDTIIPFSEIHIEFLNERYLEIIVPEAITENANEAILRTTNAILSFTIHEGDVLYKGYKKVFDLKTMEYVNNIEFSTNKSDIRACGDTLYVTNDNEYNMILDANGNIIAEGFKFCEILGEMYEISYDYSDYALYDSNMNKYYEFSRNTSIYEIDNAKFLFTLVSTSADNTLLRGVIDSSGTVLVEPQFENIYAYNDGLFIVTMKSDAGSLYGLCDMSGNIVVPCEYNLLTYKDGFYKGKGQSDSTNVILNAEGKVVAESTDSLNYFAYNESTGMSYVLALNTGEYQMEFAKRPQEQQFAFGLLTAYDETSNSYALFEYVNGTQLTEYAYEAFRYHDGCIYALSGGVYTIYRIQYQY